MFAYRPSTITIALLLSLNLPLECYATETVQLERHAVMLAEVYQANSSSKQQTFLISEKYDGIRAIWTGKELLTRNGNSIHTPKWFTEQLPDFALDGELWAGYHQFEYLQSLIHRAHSDESDWHKVRYMVFDRPQRHVAFAKRYQALYDWFHSKKVALPLQLVIHEQVDSQTEIQAILQRVIDKGGEGVMLRKPQSFYVQGRSRGLLKLKPFEDDEATIIGYRSGKGKYQGQVGAFIVKDKQGRVFAVGSGLNDLIRIKPPKMGEVITYRFQGRTGSGKPRFATFVRVRRPE